MNGTIIALDVSKDSSHVQGFLGINNPVCQPFKIAHKLPGYKEVENVIKELKRKEPDIEPAIVFEYTGAYHFPIIKYFFDQGYDCYAISPLESAKVRKSFIRVTKTDSRDCNNIMEVFYNRELRKFSIKEDDAKSLSNLRKLLVKKISRTRNILAKYIDLIWPCLQDEFFDKIGENWCDVLIHFKHPEFVKQLNLEEIIRYFQDNSFVFGRKSKIAIATHFYNYCLDCYSGVSKESREVFNLVNLLNSFISESNNLKAIESDLIDLIKDNISYKLLLSIPGVSNVLALRILSEIGDVKRFSSSKKLVAFSGLDPTILSSGKKDGLHFQITRKGSSYLRSSLYLAFESMLIHGYENQITNFYFKKKSSGLPHKVAATAACRKLLCSIYGMLINNTSFKTL